MARYHIYVANRRRRELSSGESYVFGRQAGVARAGVSGRLLKFLRALIIRGPIEMRYHFPFVVAPMRAIRASAIAAADGHEIARVWQANRMPGSRRQIGSIQCRNYDGLSQGG